MCVISSMSHVSDTNRVSKEHSGKALRRLFFANACKSVVCCVCPGAVLYVFRVRVCSVCVHALCRKV